MTQPHDSPAQPDGQVTLDVDGAVAVIRLDRPAKLNALTPAMTAALEQHLQAVDADPGLRCTVLTGTGRSFCVGSDIAGLDDYPTAWDFGLRKDYGDLLRAARTPVVAAVNGFAFGGGLELALGCDIRLAADTARFAAPEIKLGWIGGSGQAALLAHSVGPSNAARMILTGDPVDAPTALSWGLVTDVLPADELLSAALALAATIASRAPLAAQSAKIDLKAAYSMSLDDAIALERRMQTICFATADAAEGRAAFLARREPRFEGR
ncbi:enoyl-CoA hydratase/isomerase family protein [Nakamurella sp. YIM 132087]|uniref:Enoyl-CoA hydratase/isomerase family protein n=1 Tax=Nakamurella alba TaxID=2665158 RepID=A0A7K1FGV8_9ACTN|nr:enoyl-CoA hydratase/isomerase family protein [Nakamurella alba]MTD13367.1 enoyl-CoA hydratase/isomerase family protein [Nakamurella alba]